jgi:hypothetical protein
MLKRGGSGHKILLAIGHTPVILAPSHLRDVGSKAAAIETLV